MTPRSDPRPLGDAVRRVRAEARPQTPLAAVQAVWDEAVGETIAREARPVAERDAVVTVACSGAAWAQELDLLGEDLLRRVRERLPGGPLSGFRFVVGDGRYASD